MADFTLSCRFDIFQYMHVLPLIADADVHLASLLGRGRHGSVFVAHVDSPATPHRVVAVKIPHCTARARDEFEVLSRFDHPHIVRVVAEPLSNSSARQ